MSAIKKEELEKLEKEYGLEPDDLTYQHRCSRITAYMNGSGEEWKAPEKKIKKSNIQKTNVNKSHQKLDGRHHLYGKKILITPMMKPDAKRNLAYNERLGPSMVVRDYNAGDAIYGAAEDVDRMVGDYEIIHVDHSQPVYAKTTFPKIGTEISIRLGVDLVPVVRGNDGKIGYIWSFPTKVVQVEDTQIQLYGLKTLIRNTFPEIENKFSGKPIMDYIDGVTLAASIPQTHALLKEHIRQEAMARNAGLPNSFNGF